MRPYVESLGKLIANPPWPDGALVVIGGAPPSEQNFIGHAVAGLARGSIPWHVVGAQKGMQITFDTLPFSTMLPVGLVEADMKQFGTAPNAATRYHLDPISVRLVQRIERNDGGPGSTKPCYSAHYSPARLPTPWEIRDGCQ